ncbi:MAG: insulinase family protein [Cytophagales bacterium]|nr:insulinase family protein [Armatimonadota bacterium]
MVFPKSLLCFSALALAIAPGLVVPVADAAAAPAASAVAPAVPRLNYQKRILANGLTVLTAENHATPTAAVYVWYKVGGKNDPPGRSGFAHLFEHMMFKSTKNQPSESFDRLTEDVGGENNAFTADDVTVYHETIPSNYLEPLLWAEADRMRNLNVISENFASERSVVKEELRQRILASPYGMLSLYIAQRSFTTHPYKRQAIGSIRDLDAATLADVRSFYSAFYRPDNAVLVVVGDFDPAQLDGWVDKYFGAVPRPAGVIPRVVVKEPARTREKRFNETAPNVPLPVVVFTYLTPSESSRDAPALQIADAILSGGESSRLYKSLVYTQQIAVDVRSDADLRADAGLFEVDATVASGKTVAAVERSLRDQIAAFAAKPVTAQELTKAKNQVITGALRTRETNDGTAAALGNAAVLLGDPEAVNTSLQKLQAVTAQDVQRVARQYLTPRNLVVIRYSATPASAAEKKVGAK